MAFSGEEKRASAKLLVNLALRKRIRPVPHQGNSGTGKVEFLEFRFGQADGSPSQKIIQMGWISCSGNRRNPRFPGKHPGQGELGRSHAPAFRPFPDKNSQRHVESEGFRSKPGQSGAAVPLLKTAVLPDGSCQKGAPQRTIRNKTDAQLFNVGKSSSPVPSTR